MSAEPMTGLSEQDVTTHDVVAPTGAPRRKTRLGLLLVAVGLLSVFGFGLGSGPGKDAAFRFTTVDARIPLPVLTLPATATAIVLGLLVLAIGAWFSARGFPRASERYLIALAVVLSVLAFLAWANTGTPGTVLDLRGLLLNTLLIAVPLVLGAMAGIVSERSGVINVAIEGQMLAGAFAASMIGTLVGSLVSGVVAAMVIGALVGALLAVFAIKYLVNQVILGVVINLLVLGLTNYLYSSLLQRNAETLNQPGVFTPVRIPLLSDIPFVGPILFEANILVYLTYAVVVVLQLALFRTRWGLRTRSVGEHPKAADTLGINVNRLRYRNSLLAGAIAGLAGAYVSIGVVGPFNANMTAGRGFIALAAVIFGRWTPIGAIGASLLFAFCSSLQTLLSIVGTPVVVPSQFLAMLPYLATVVVVAGVVGRVQAPAADGVPYTKS